MGVTVRAITKYTRSKREEYGHRYATYPVETPSKRSIIVSLCLHAAIAKKQQSVPIVLRIRCVCRSSDKLCCYPWISMSSFLDFCTR